jgi:hypothetical protein
MLAGGRPGGAMPGDGILRETIIGGEVEAAAHPPDRVGTVGAEEPDIHVRGGSVRIQRVVDDGDAHRAETAPGELRPVVRGGRRQFAPADVREGHPALLQHRASGDDAGPTAAAFGPGPGIVLVLGLAIDLLEERAQAILQPQEVFADDFGIHDPAIQRRPPRGVNAGRDEQARIQPGLSPLCELGPR